MAVCTYISVEWSRPGLNVCYTAVVKNFVSFSESKIAISFECKKIFKFCKRYLVTYNNNKNIYKAPSIYKYQFGGAVHEYVYMRLIILSLLR
jgi:hypothetical protein